VIWSKKKEEQKPILKVEESKPAMESAPKPINLSAPISPISPVLSSPLGIEKQPARGMENVRSVLSEGTVINGRLTFDTPVKIDGKLSGEVFSSDTLVVGKTGKIDAKIEVQTLIVQGHVSGEVYARDMIEVVEGGVLTADITTKKLVIRDAVFSGACKMS
jgi:cytoskeletal protein CcmA (bactofilin family)